MKYTSVNVLSGVDTATQTGVAVDSSQIISASFQAVFGDTSAVGTLQIQASNDITHQGNYPTNFTPANWTNVPNGSAAITAGGSAIVFLPQVSYRWLRAVYTYTSGGSTTVNVNMFAVDV